MSLKERTHTTPIKEDRDSESQDRLAVTPCTLQMEADDSMISVTRAFKEKVVEVVNRNNVILLRKIVRDHLFQDLKFITNRNYFERPSGVNGGIIRLIMDGMNWSSKSDYEKAVLWNTYNGCVFKEIGQCRSTAITAIKKTLIKGNNWIAQHAMFLQTTLISHILLNIVN